ncbi:hypothetical protein ACSNOI_43055, partial [Actinomadura kijaniata]
FRPDDGPTVASRTVRNGGDACRIDVKPFYRDGAYLVAVFTITSLGRDDLNPIEDYSGEPGGRFGAFNVVDPGTGTTHRGVMIGPPATTSVTFRAGPFGEFTGVPSGEGQDPRPGTSATDRNTQRSHANLWSASTSVLQPPPRQ